MRLSEAVDIQALMEAPLPDDWEADIFDQRVPFPTRVEYAKQKARGIGMGSARVAFIIPFQGLTTVLKVARNRRGEVQNREEAKLLASRDARSSGLFIPLIDFDTRNSDPTWIQTALAREVGGAHFERLFGGDARALVAFAKQEVLGEEDTPGWINFSKFDPEHPFVQRFVSWYASTRANIDDYGNPGNWGMYKGNLVIIDAGLTDDIFAQYYVTDRGRTSSHPRARSIDSFGLTRT